LALHVTKLGLGNEETKETALYANWPSGEAQTFVSAGSNPACATEDVYVQKAADGIGGHEQRPVRLAV
jgi:hypothetical protein